MGLAGEFGEILLTGQDPAVKNPIPVKVEAAGTTPETARLEVIGHGKNAGGATFAVLLDSIRALVVALHGSKQTPLLQNINNILATEPRGSVNLPFLQEVAGRLICLLQGKNLTSLSQNTLDQLQVEAIPGLPPVGFDETRAGPTATPVAEAAILGPVTAAQTWQVDNIIVANKSGVALIAEFGLNGPPAVGNHVAILPVAINQTLLYEPEGGLVLNAGDVLRHVANVAGATTTVNYKRIR